MDTVLLLMVIELLQLCVLEESKIKKISYYWKYLEVQIT